MGNKEENASYVYSKIKNACSGYFCSFITLPNPYNKVTNNRKNNYSLKIKNEKYLKQYTNELSEYNNEYINEIREKCLDIVNCHSENLIFNNSNPNQILNRYKDNPNRYSVPNNSKRGVNP